MSWVQATLLARGLCRAWGGSCGAALTGTSISQVPCQLPRGLHCSAAAYSSEQSLVPSPPEPRQRPTKALVPFEDLFGQAPSGERDKASFLQAVQKFGERSVRKRGHVDFIYLALRKMREYGVERDLAVYNQLLNIFPKEVFRPRSIIQRIFVHYPRQQECGIAVLEQMENHGVMPNKETEFLLIEIFGRKSYPMLKLVRLKLWFPRFMNINPFPVPRDLPQDPVELAMFGLRHMEPDLSARVTIYQVPLPKDSTGAADPPQPHIVELTCCPRRRGKLKRCRRSGTSTTRCSWTWSMRGVAGTTTSLTSMKWRKALSSPCVWQVPMTRRRWLSGSRACRRPTQPWLRSPWSSAWSGPPGSSRHPLQGWRSRPCPRTTRKKTTTCSGSSRARAESEPARGHRLWPEEAVD
ncbi:evolutionarily conserved signaling intermediate in Toll pathway, mitochondrial isoform X2 [Symphalangus syndactylus]|uniref:evolutionarily conserved signaling intermediate in Toll pathway, mitochondrial isoform X2 n=1 Tax=Symphalangus syndactylus TaxID=9590 RepID=UPI0024419488|nr:evolutionarily conserved signaling intermediate in Toll pathway, mitochondrial isoform X2 [Symphalangus syndactylus]